MNHFPDEVVRKHLGDRTGLTEQQVSVSQFKLRYKGSKAHNDLAEKNSSFPGASPASSVGGAGLFTRLTS